MNDYVKETRKFQPLKPWLKGNCSITPRHFYTQYTPDLLEHLFLSLDIVVPLHDADTVSTSNTKESWQLNRNYIKKVLQILAIDEEDCDMELAEDEKEEVLLKLGEPPYSCYNLYFITIKNNDEEKIVYVGQTNATKSRFIGGHHAALKLHAPQYSGYQKYVYFGTVTFTATDNGYLPMECLETTGQIRHLLNDIERILIYEFKPELNTQKYKYKFINQPKLQIENHTGASNFLDFYLIDWTR